MYITVGRPSLELAFELAAALEVAGAVEEEDWIEDKSKGKKYAPVAAPSLPHAAERP